MKNKLFEDPDTYPSESPSLLNQIDYDNMLTVDDEDARPFGLNKAGEIWIGNYGEYHDASPFDTKRRIYTYQYYQGRFWDEHNVISFWHQPPKSKLMYILDLLNKNNYLDYDKLEIEIFNDKDKWRVLSLSEYPENVNQASDTLVRTEHNKSPLLRKNKTVPMGLGSKKKRTWNKNQKPFESLVTESPDVYPSLNQNNKVLSWRQPPRTDDTLDSNTPSARAFGLDKLGKIFIAADGKKHDSFEFDDNFDTIHQYYQGRFWENENVISFWELPDKKILMGIISDINKEFNLDLSKLKVEVFTDEDKWRVLSLSEYPESTQYTSDTLIRPDHEKSPLLKKTTNVPDGLGSKKKRTWDKSQKPFESLVTESPDEIFGMDPKYHYMKSIANYDTYMTHAFGYFDNKMYVSNEKGTHPGILMRLGVGQDLEDRKRFTYPGRIWLDQKLISFWLYPKNNNELKKVITDLENALSEYLGKNVNIWNDPEYKIDVNLSDDNVKTFGQDVNGQWGKFNDDSIKQIPLKDFEGSSDASDEEMKVPHMLTATEKEKLRKQKKLMGVPKGSGSRKNKESLKQRQAKMTSECVINENPNVVFYEDEPLMWSQTDCIVFSRFIDDELFFGKETHHTLLNSYLMGLSKEELDDWEYPIHGRGVDSGRLFLIPKIMSFWFYPENKSRFLKLLDDIKAKTGIDIKNDKEWTVEIPSESNIHNVNKPAGWGGWMPSTRDQEYIPIDEYQGGYRRPKSEIKVGHNESPLLKGNNKVPSGIGSKKKTWNKHQKPFESFDPINENPNAIIKPKDLEKFKDQPYYKPNNIVEYDADQNIAFGFYGPSETLVVGEDETSMHSELMKTAYDRELIPKRDFLIERGQNSGRLFVKYKVITFWVFPSSNAELLKVIRALEDEIGIDILSDPGWLVEIPNGEFKAHIDKRFEKGYSGWGSWKPMVSQVDYVSISDYKGDYKRSIEDLNSNHNLTPSEKEELRKQKKLDGVPNGIGSRKDKTPLNWRQAKVSEDLETYFK